MAAQMLRMRMEPDEIAALISQVLSVPIIVLISIILSGTMLRRVLPPLAAQGGMKLPTIVLWIGVRGDGAAYGLLFFILSLVFSFIAVPQSAHQSFMDKSGLELKPWLFFLLVASVLSLVISTAIFFLIETLIYNPILSKDEREKQLEDISEALEKDREAGAEGGKNNGE
jgi:hypothetical protein